MPSNIRRCTAKNLLFALIALLMGGLTGNAIAAPLAILTDVTGRVTVHRGNKNYKGVTGTPLEQNDAISVRSGTAKIYYATRAPETLKVGGPYPIGAKGTVTKTSSAWGNVFAGVSSGFARGRIGKKGTMRPRDPLLLAPVRTTITTDRPLFIWTKAEMVADYVLILRKVVGEDTGEDAGEEIWRKITPHTSYLYDGDALERGVLYKWNVIPRDTNLVMLDTQQASPVRFTIASTEKVQAVQEEREAIQQALAEDSVAARHEALMAMLTSNDLHLEVLMTLVPEVFSQESLAKDETYNTFKQAVSKLNESDRILLNSSMMDCGQLQLASLIDVPKIAPEKLELEEGETETDNTTETQKPAATEPTPETPPAG